MKKLFVCGVVIALAGCADMQTVNESLRKVNETLAGATSVPVGKLGDGTGYQPDLQVSVPGGVCDRTAFLDGFKDTYVQNWREFVDLKLTTHQNLAKGKNPDAAAKRNVALYKKHQIGMQRYTSRQGDYPPDFSGKNCRYQSYVAGQSSGTDAYARDMKALVAQEAKVEVSAR